ncbi:MULTISPECIES: prolyl oligopeptidase family serine peptidase [unclassified Arcicella]|uniref:S9 family peptidase n=1 Tax=unclassified Arcicella TaxID=2644986 RepID=UPI00285C416B|nr:MULTISPECIES: prolyl oligopeptidase family serine peptidase [unclassified Arcicella]MDR6561385.1 dipeptidyl aminopeptidase/acylaminoacyl peptidase [Arcicella sp. BE51]MDR6811269.1 dipeptidyl aminopeptidase/acylaminoacyl peptidase [Arcicella sp. BE140]MDR6822619.1 dipeptidyl aminopeptidase/acylaminoacyl peptidase [Arcicella sp. BE139]
MDICENEGYKMPPKVIADLVTANVTPSVSVDSKGEWMVLLQRSAQPSIEQLAQPELKLAGLRINPTNNGPSRTAYFVSIKLRKVLGTDEVMIKGLPEKPLLSYASWSPDDSKIAFCNSTPDKIELWVLDITTATARKVSDLGMNAVFGHPYVWLSDGKSLIAKTVDPNRGNPPQKNAIPTGPTIVENLGKTNPSRTYQDLLKNESDEKLFEFYATSVVVKINLEGETETIIKANIIRTASTSPNGKYILVKTIHRPFSYLVPYNRFPQKIEIFGIDGVLVKTLVDNPLIENVPILFDAVQKEPRGFNWRADVPATIYWIEAQDGGDPKNEVTIRDKVFALSAPFTGNYSTIAETNYRYTGIIWANETLALMEEYWHKTRRVITKIIDPSGQHEAQILFDRSSEDKYNEPGNPSTKKNQYSKLVMDVQKDNTVFMTGDGASAEGDRPFVDILNLTTKETTRLWRSEAPFYERPIAILDNDKQIVLTVRESKQDNPNYFVRDLLNKNITQLTFFPHPYPALKGVAKQVLKYKRPDGVELTANLYLPADYQKEQGALPCLLEAYPLEFKDKSNAGQISGSPYEFTSIYWGSPIFWVTQGFAILEGASIPIVGEGNVEPNDTYLEQLVAGAKAAIDEGVRLGVVDSNRVGVMGHSYGAFMVANLLSHSDLFKAGIARSGAYNRTLTPFGFQGEERSIWQTPETYYKMSPFNYADKMKTPLLLIHGEADNNMGTFPMQSERYYNALKGLGATVRYVQLPYESHGYQAKESILHMLWEMDTWLTTYVKEVKMVEMNVV